MGHLERFGPWLWHHDASRLLALVHGPRRSISLGGSDSQHPRLWHLWPIQGCLRLVVDRKSSKTAWLELPDLVARASEVSAHHHDGMPCSDRMCCTSDRRVLEFAMAFETSGIASICYRHQGPSHVMFQK